MKRLIIFLVTFSFLAPAFAEQKKKRYKKGRQEVSFDGTDIDGVARNPNASYLVQKRGIDFLPLYKVREAYDDSIKESLDYLR
jgi:hypothetical protein